MAITYERIVLEDLEVGVGNVSVTMPAGGTATGTKINLANILEAGGFTIPVLATGAGKTVDDVIGALQTYGLLKQS